MANNTTNTPIQLFVVSTSHMDWDWNQTFEEYYQTNSGSTPVRTILQNAIALLQDVTLPIPYQFNLAEIAWLQRFLREFPEQLGVLQGFTPNQLVFLGGGITSPDNLVCNGEAFIRNYLVGRRFLKEMKLDAALTDVCWIPDDFGQDPQLPVVLNAMGLNGVGFWRVPGNEPSPPNGNPQVYNGSNYVPINGNAPISYQLMQDGVTFFWQAADGSKILTQQMSSGYGVIWNQAESGDGEADAETLNNFVHNSGLQPGNLLMAPCGGDFSNPSANLVDAVKYYNLKYSKANNIKAGIATFQDFINAMNAYEAANPSSLQTIAMDASNFWTGYFASRPQLKINHQQGVNVLMATETLGTLLQVQYPALANQWTAIAPAIAEAWELLSPSTHHDYVTGTSPDNVYAVEQLPLGNKALETAKKALEQTLALLGGAVKTNPTAGQVAYIVYNPSGFRRRETGNWVEIPATPDLDGMNSVLINEGTTLVPIQRTSDGKIVFPCYTDTGTPSMMYTTVYFTPAIVEPSGAPLSETGLDSYTLSNGLVSMTARADEGWAISSLIDIGNNNFQVLKDGGLGNQLMLYYESAFDTPTYYGYGNIYQMGNELAPTATNGSGFYTDSSSAFTAVTDNGAYAASVVDNGPYVWRLQAKVANTTTDAVAEITYALYANEPVVRMEITGKAASSIDNSIVAAWAISDKNNNVPSGILYGTGNHWNDAATPQSNNPYAFTPYWNGPNFRPVHDYLTLQPYNNPAGEPMAAVYNEAMRAWSYYGGLLLGTLFRNPPGRQRGAHGTVTGTVTQRYAFRVPGANGIGRPETCQPLQESMAFQQPLLAVAAAPFAGVAASLPESATLIAPIANNCLVRVARPQEPVENEPFSFVLRIYQPTNNTTQNWQFNLPVGGTGIQLQMVTALEGPLAEPPAKPPIFGSGAITIYDMPTLATLQVQL